jgi:penicillin-binding protein 1A
VRAIVGGRDYGASQFNRAIDAARQPGSSFKPFVYFTALLTGTFNATTVVDGNDLCIGNWCPHNYGGAHAGRLPLVNALQASLNTVAVRLSIAIGEFYWPKNKSYHLAHIAELGRAKIVETARKMGLTTPLPDTVSLPLGADDVKMMDMASAYAVFANGGTKVVPYAALEVRNSHDEVIWYRDRDAPPQPRLYPAEKIAEMNNMLKEVVAAGTARAAQLPGVVAAGKTGTTNAYKDAWFDGFTGNFVGSVWFGNDDDTSMNNMTGGTLPARTWHEIMAFAHQGVELKNPYGITSQPPPISAAPLTTASINRPQRQSVLSQKTKDTLSAIIELFARAREAKRASL